jgi:hypothetical protein
MQNPSRFALMVALFLSGLAVNGADNSEKPPACAFLLSGYEGMPVIKAHIKNRLINEETGTSWVGKIMSFPLGCILSVTTGRSFHEKLSVGDICEIIGFVVGEEYWPVEIVNGIKVYQGLPLVAEKRPLARDYILQQYPELIDIDGPAYQTEPQILEWIRQMEEKFGTFLPLVQVRSNRGPLN